MKKVPDKPLTETLLFHIQQLINNPSHAGENKAHTDALVEIFESITSISAHFDMNDWQDANLSSGVAISPVQAARCLQETVRTQAFLKGVKAAIEEKLNAHDTLHILYAGTGPYGPLLLPLLGYSLSVSNNNKNTEFPNSSNIALIGAIPVPVARKTNRLSPDGLRQKVPIGASKRRRSSTLAFSNQ